MNTLTPRQQQVYDFIAAFIRDEGYSPAIRDIQGHFGYGSPNAVMTILRPLRRKGFVDWRPGVARSLTVTGRTCPHCGGKL